MTESNTYKLDDTIVPAETNFFSENPDLQIVKSVFDPHTNRIYFYLANKFNHAITLTDFYTPATVD